MPTRRNKLAYAKWARAVKVSFRLTIPRRSGTVANIAPTKKIDMTMGPLLGSALKMW
jgi:hypothetical protein